jgi:hypothetical protein
MRSIVLLLIVIASPLFAETTLGWKDELISKLNVTQSNYDNWAKGGENTLSWQISINARLDNDRELSLWSNTMRFNFGHTRAGSQESRKSVDEVKLESVYTYKLGIHINPYIAVGLETQITAGYEYKNDIKLQVADAFDPSYYTQSLGFGYAMEQNFKTRTGLAIKETVSRNFTRFSDDPMTRDHVETVKVETGMESVTDYNQKVNESLTFTSKLEIFSNLERIDEVDVRWDNLLSAKVAEYVDVGLNIKLLYDRDQSIRRQLKQVLTLGLTYIFL